MLKCLLFRDLANDANFYNIKGLYFKCMQSFCIQYSNADE